MKNNKSKRIIAIIALVFMVIASVTIVITLVNPKLLGGSIGYIALVSFLFGVGFFLVIKLFYKEPKEQPQQPEYLPKPDEGEVEDRSENEQSDGQEQNEQPDVQEQNGQDGNDSQKDDKEE